MTGLNISSFLKHTNDGGRRGQWLRDWRKNGEGQVTVWLHTRAPIIPSFTHQFMLEDEYEDKETKKKVPFLRFSRFVTCDPELVHRNQYFRFDDGTMKNPPDRDPFLILREWLRRAEHLPLEEPIFKWNDVKNRKAIVWERGEISGLVKRGKANWGHSLDTKLEYVYVVVDDDDIKTGPVLAREGKLLSQKIVAVIKQQQSQFGEDGGDPAQHPYAFVWQAIDTNVPMNAYNAFKAEGSEFTNEVWEKIQSEEYPDPTSYGEPEDGDMEKIRDAFTAAAQVELPIDEIFSEDSEVRQALIRGEAKRAPARASKAAQARTAVKPPVPQAGGQKPAETNGAQAKPNGAQAKPATSGPQPRRKKVEEPPAETEPEQETIPCDDCQHPMLATDTKCSNCGTQYEVEQDAPPAAAKPATPKPTPKTTAAAKPGTTPKPATNKPATTAKPKPTGGGTKAAPKPETQEEGGVEAANCWSCQSPLNGERLCPECGLEQGDDIPF